MREKLKDYLMFVEDEVTRVFDRSNINWRSFEFNEFFLKQCEIMLNDKFKITGYVSLNDVFYMLGFPQTSFGAVAGWSKLYDGEQHVSFGIDWNDINGNIDAWALRFNVHGVVFSDIDKIEKEN